MAPGFDTEDGIVTSPRNSYKYTLNSDPSKPIQVTKKRVPRAIYELMHSFTRENSNPSDPIQVTTQRMESRLSDGVTPLKIGKDTDPCTVSGAILGAYDMVACGARVVTNPPDTLIYDTPSVIYEINSRKNATGRCDLVTVGPPFNPSGFGIGFPYHATFNIAFDQAIFDIVSTGMMEKLEAKYRIGTKFNDCEQEQTSELAMTIKEMMGLFVVTGGLIVLALGHGVYERR